MKNINACRIIMYEIMLTGLVIIWISIDSFGLSPLHSTFYIGAAVLIGGFIYGIITIRCPFCNHLLSFFEFETDRCPVCKNKLYRKNIKSKVIFNSSRKSQ